MGSRPAAGERYSIVLCNSAKSSHRSLSTFCHLQGTSSAWFVPLDQDKNFHLNLCGKLGEFDQALSGVITTGGVIQAVFGSNNVGPRWPGFDGLRGDSYTAIGFDSWQPIPTDLNPMGVPYPGATWIDGANWAGYLTTQYNRSKLLTFDYAIGGNTVQGVRNQIMGDFLSTRGAGHKPHYAPWTASDSLFGGATVSLAEPHKGLYPDHLNMSSSTHAPINPTINELFDLYETLYRVGARNFLFVSVPPIDRAPFGELLKLSDRDALMPQFSSMMHGAAALYTELLDNPIKYGFSDTTTVGGSFWYDPVHPKTKVHGYMAANMAEFLSQY
ncbi:hypothetical protein AG1IA_06103 [Rhizoctonia solani AG-1 IA]|uniref:Uncharacterized protein n=1 Tax=Thanatephorus cucumeris (strain AG1-IA) TaxID=983506 RepID=L8WP09_THACA|nr:hypothetical protein AG1IA_06103 [Rhizoctonia solani AG-1 IA]